MHCSSFHTGVDADADDDENADGCGCGCGCGCFLPLSYDRIRLVVSGKEQ
jgi:hypothetical protein